MRHHHSTRSCIHAHRTAAVLPECNDTVTPRPLGAVERLVCSLEHFLRSPVLCQPLGDADTDGHRDTGRGSDTATLATLLVVLRAVVLITQLNVVGCLLYTSPSPRD